MKYLGPKPDGHKSMNKRSKAISEYINNNFKNVTLYDIGCGDRKIEKLLNDNINYFGFDKNYNKEYDSIFFDFEDFSSYNFQKCDISIFLGSLEYSKSMKKIIERFKSFSSFIVISYIDKAKFLKKDFEYYDSKYNWNIIDYNFNKNDFKKLNISTKTENFWIWEKK